MAFELKLSEPELAMRRRLKPWLTEKKKIKDVFYRNVALPVENKFMPGMSDVYIRRTMAVGEHTVTKRLWLELKKFDGEESTPACVAFHHLTSEQLRFVRAEWDANHGGLLGLRVNEDFWLMDPMAWMKIKEYALYDWEEKAYTLGAYVWHGEIPTRAEFWDAVDKLTREEML